VGYVERVGEKRKAFMALTGNPEGTDNSRDLEVCVTSKAGMGYLTQNKVKKLAFVKLVMNFQFP
jgi:hypothetical protein